MGVSRPSGLLAVLLLLLAAGCTTKMELSVSEDVISQSAAPPGVRPGAPETAPPPAGPPWSGGAVHNEQDLDYVRDMGRLHPQAIRMAYLAQLESVSPAVLALATKIRDHRFEEMTHVTYLAAVWHAGHFGRRSGMVPGELTERQLRELEALEGRAFERRWVAHLDANRSAVVALSRVEIERGRNASARAFARRFNTTLSKLEGAGLKVLAASRRRR